MQTRRRIPLPSQPPLRSNSNAGNVIYRKPSVVRSRDGVLVGKNQDAPIGTIRQGTRTTVDYRKTNTLKTAKTKQKTKKQSGDETEPFGSSTSVGTIYLTTPSGIRKAKQIGLVSKPDKFITGRVSGELNVVSNQHMVNKKLVNKDGKLNPTLQGWESRNLTSGRTKRQLNQGANFGMPIFYHPSVFDNFLYERRMKMKELKKPEVRQGRV